MPSAREILEDVALAHNVKRSRRTIRFRYAPEALSTRMYRTTAEMIEGWTKNLALLFPRPISLALWRMLDLVLFFGLPALALGIFWLVTWQRGASCCSGPERSGASTRVSLAPTFPRSMSLSLSSVSLSSSIFWFAASFTTASKSRSHGRDELRYNYLAV